MSVTDLWISTSLPITALQSQQPAISRLHEVNLIWIKTKK